MLLLLKKNYLKLNKNFIFSKNKILLIQKKRNFNTNDNIENKEDLLKLFDSIFPPIKEQEEEKEKKFSSLKIKTNISLSEILKKEIEKMNKEKEKK